MDKKVYVKADPKCSRTIETELCELQTEIEALFYGIYHTIRSTHVGQLEELRNTIGLILGLLFGAC